MPKSAANTNLSALPHILVVDDDNRIRALVSRFLMEKGFVCMAAASATEASEILKGFSFDAIVLDVMMPGKSGIDYLEDLRAEGNNIPVLMLTALGEANDRISGLEAGADDYLAKPFEPREMILRLNAILRRSGIAVGTKESQVRYKIGKWQYTPMRDEIEAEDEVMRLTSVEANLLRSLAEKNGEVLSREELAAVCKIDSAERTIDVQVTRLRRKIEDNTKMPRHLITIRGKGYMLRAEKI